MLGTFRLFTPSVVLLSAITAAGDVGASMIHPQTDAIGSAVSMHLPTPLPDSGKAALLMIEFVDEWLAPNGKLRPLLRDHEQFARSQSAGVRALSAAREAGMPVIHVTLQLSPDYRELGHARFGLRGAIPKAGTWKKNDSGWNFRPAFVPRPEEFVVSGRTGASAFSSSDLDNYLRGQGITRVYLAGYATHVCIESTMRAAHDLGYEPVVLSDATAAFTSEQQQYFLEQVVHHFGWSMSADVFTQQLNAVSQTDATIEGHEVLPQVQMQAVNVRGQEIPGVSSAVVLQRGRLLLLSGHVPYAADGAVPRSLEAQLGQVFRNLDATLLHAGGSTANLAKLTFYVRDYEPEQLNTIRRVRDAWLGEHAPASSLVGVQALFHPDVLVEVEGIAVLE